MKLKFKKEPDNIDDDDEQDVFAEAGLDYDELEFMDLEERREVLEDAGLDPDYIDLDADQDEMEKVRDTIIEIHTSFDGEFEW